MIADQPLYDIVAKVLEVPVETVTPALSRDTSESWDSFNHLLLISAIESELGVKFTLSQIEKVRSVSDLRAIVAQHRSQ